MRHLFTVVTFCCALGIASPCQAALIEIGTITLFELAPDLGVQVIIENTSGGEMFENRPIEDAFTNIVLTVAGLDYSYGSFDIGDVPDFYLSSQGVTPHSGLAGAAVSFVSFEPALFPLDATVTFSFGIYQGTGGGALGNFESMGLFVDIPEAAPVPEPGTLLLLSGGLALAAGRRAFRRQNPPAR